MSKRKKFNPSTYAGKDTVYVPIQGIQGICSIWDWNKNRSKYVKRECGNRFYAYKAIAGNQVSKSFRSFDESKRWRENPDASIDDVTFQDMTFLEVHRLYFEKERNRLRVSTFETYESHAKHLWFFHGMNVSNITARTIDDWLTQIKRKDYLNLQHSNRLTYRHELSVLRRILVYYSEYVNDAFVVPVKERHWRDCIVDHMKHQIARDKNKERFIPRGEFERFLVELHETAALKADVKTFAVLAEFMLGTGTRVGEACAVSWNDIDLDSGSVRIGKTVQWSRKKGRPTVISPLTKTSESRTVFMTRRAIGALSQWKREKERSSGLVFSVDGFAPVAYRSVQHYFNAALEKLGVQWRSTHILRHSFATDFLEKTGNKTALQGQLGHKSAKQTEHYAKITDMLKLEGIRAYDNRLNEGLNVVELRPRETKENSEGLGETGSTQQS